LLTQDLEYFVERLAHTEAGPRTPAAMPEGHTIHRLALDLTRVFAKAPVRVSSPQGRFEGADALDGKVFTRALAIGKHLFLEFKDARVHIHLGLFGKFKPQKLPSTARPSVRLRIETQAHVWDLTGPTQCARIDAEAFAALRSRLGADPLSSAARPAATWRKVSASKRSIAALLLDQSIIAGIGNVYRAELLFLVGVHPETPGRLLTKEKFDALWKLSRKLLAGGVKANRIVTVIGASSRAPKREALYVYKQRYCRVCSVPVVQGTNATRTIFHCPHCQPKMPE
jgi:endonuclease VIII